MRGFLASIVLVFAAVGIAHGQTADREATEERLQDLRYQIEQDQRRLAETAEAERATLSTLEDMDREIALRRELYETYRRRIRELERESDSLRTSLTRLERDLDEMRERYQARVRHAYKFGRMHDLALIMSAESINQMLVRARYLARFSNDRRARLAIARETMAEINARREDLQANVDRNAELLRGTEAEQRELARLQRSRQQVVQELRAQRGNIEAEIQRKRTAARELESRIQQLIAAESRAVEAPTAEPFDAEAYAALTGSFTDNRGRLPWPSRGVVREPFGDIVNPVYGTSTPNPGILIDTQPQAEVRSVFDGRVVDVDVMPDFGTIIVIQHGEYRTVYSNFSALYVNAGDFVTAGQMIGRAGTDNEPRGRSLFFAIFQNGQAIDPQPWLSRL